MGYKIKKHSGASKRFKKTKNSVKTRVRVEIIFYQSNQLRENGIKEELVIYQILHLR